MTTYTRKGERSFHPIIVRVADHHEVDPALIKAIIMAESGYNPRAISEKGAKGLMQLMPATAEALGVEDSFNPEQNIKGGVKYFKQLVIQFEGDVKLALAAYNAGSKKVRHYQGIPPFKTTQCYIDKVFTYYQIYKKQSGHGADKV
jgi:soluble lytic murein transglycosylase-like protein